MAAARWGHAPCVGLLLGKGAKVEQVDIVSEGLLQFPPPLDIEVLEGWVVK